MGRGLKRTGSAALLLMSDVSRRSRVNPQEQVCHNPQSAVLGLWARRRGADRHPQPEGAAVSVHAVRRDLQYHEGHGLVSRAEAVRPCRHGGDAAGVGVSGADDCGGLRAGRAHGGRLATADRRPIPFPYPSSNDGGDHQNGYGRCPMLPDHGSLGCYQAEGERYQNELITHCSFASQSRATAAVQDWSREPSGSPVNGS